MSLPLTAKTDTATALSSLKTQLSPDTLDFCIKHEILQYLPIAIDLIKRHLPLEQPNWGLEREQDPETGEEWFTINVTLKGKTGEILDKYDNYTKDWVSSVPWPERDKICLIYSVLKQLSNRRIG